MYTLPGKRDGFKLTLPDDFLVDEIKEKYTFILQKNKQFVHKPIDFINETIQKVQVFGFSNAAFEQQQPTRAYPLRNNARIQKNDFLTGSSAYQYRNAVPPISLTDKTINIEFRHTLGYLNYMILMENFIYLYTKDTRSDKMFSFINLELFNQIGEVYAKIRFDEPIINGMDMLDFDYAQPIAQSGTFKLELKYSNFDYEFIVDKPNSIAQLEGDYLHDELSNCIEHEHKLPKKNVPDDVYKF